MKTTNSLPKYWVVKSDTSNSNWKKVIAYLNKIYGRDWYRGTDNAYYGFDGSTFYKGTNVYCDLSSFINNPTLLTIEEFVEMTEAQTNKSKETMKTITHTQAQQIIDIACSTWKQKLFTKWGKNIVMKDSILIPERDYQDMRDACTSEQHQLFDVIFGKDVKFKVGDWIMFEGSFKAGPYQIKSFTTNGSALDQNGEWRDIQSQYRLATEDELKPNFKIGDWVYIGEVSHRWNSIVQLTKDSDKSFGYAKTKQGDESWFNVEFIERHATQEEIQKAQYIPKGTPCLVRDNIHSNWELTYSLGDGSYLGEISIRERKQVQVLDMNNLPKY